MTRFYALLFVYGCLAALASQWVGMHIDQRTGLVVALALVAIGLERARPLHKRMLICRITSALDDGRLEDADDLKRDLIAFHDTRYEDRGGRGRCLIGAIVASLAR